VAILFSSRKSKILYGILILLVIGLLAEVSIRVLAPSSMPLHPNYVKISRGFADLDALIRDNQNAHTAPKYYEEFLYSVAPVTTDYVTFTDYYSARLTPDSVPLAAAQHIVWTFGGSTMENRETTDTLTIANTLAKEFNESLGPTHVKNFGTVSFFSSLELIKFQKLLREVPDSERPTIAIFYDGYNDAIHGYLFGAGRMQSDLSQKLQALVENRYFVNLLYATSNLIKSVSRIWELTGARLVEVSLFSSTCGTPVVPGCLRPRDDDANLDAAIRAYISNFRMIHATCREFEIRCFFILQPLIAIKRPLTPFEQKVLDGLKIGPRGIGFVRKFYANVIEELASHRSFIDASQILNDRTVPDFYDIGHTGPESAPVIGERLARILIERRSQSR
jgi:hypothetical protein